MPKLGLVNNMTGHGGGVTYMSSASVAELNRFYAEQLDSAGWEVETQNTDDAMYTSNSYRRGDEGLTFSLGADGNADDPKVMVSLVPTGTTSAADVPRYPGTEVTFESPATANVSVVGVGGFRNHILHTCNRLERDLFVCDERARGRLVLIHDRPFGFNDQFVCLNDLGAQAGIQRRRSVRGNQHAVDDLRGVADE